ncbi:MAG: hypothetical protein K2X45_11350 [Phreatobacter sp.]|nr:hypothetical protein [Phreatobacter sp.]
MIKHVALVAFAALLAGCVTARETPAVTPVAVQPVPVGRVETSALPAPAPAGQPTTAAASSPSSAVPLSTRSAVSAPSRLEVDGMRTAPGARESTSLSNVSRVSTGAATGGNALGGTIMSGQGAGAIPTTIDRNREPVRRVSIPRDPVGPGTAAPVIAPELRDTTGRSIRNRQEVQF